MRWWCVAALCLPICGSALAETIPFLPPVAVCPQVKGDIKVNGDLSDPAWASAALLAPFVLAGTGTLASEQTTVRVLCTERAICFGFDCAESSPAEIRANAKINDGGDVWLDDEVEVFIAPRDAVQRGYCHMLVNPLGTIDAETYGPNSTDRKLGWSCGATVATGRTARGWTCEIAIPFTALRAIPTEGDAWQVNVNRAEQPHHEWSSWAPIQSGFHEPARFGMLRFAAAPVVTGVDLPVPFLGKNRFSVALSAPPPAGQYIAAIQTIRGTTGSRKAAVPISQAQAAGDYTLSDEGDGYVRIAVQQAQTKQILYSTPCIGFSVPEAELRLQKMLAKANVLREQIAGMKNPAALEAVTGDFTRLDAALSSLKAGLARSREQGLADRAQWNQAMVRLEELSGPLATLQMKGEAYASLGRDDPLPGYGIAIENALRKIRRDDHDLEPGRAMRLFAAQNDRESAQIAIIPFANLHDVKVSWSDLRGPNGAMLPAGNIQCWFEGYVKTRTPAYPVDYVGWYPDPLLPLQPFDAIQGQVQPLWVTVFAPAGAAPGDYTGTITLRPEGQPAGTVSLTLTVWNFALPLRGKLKTAFSMLFRNDIPRWYGFPDGTVPHDFLLKYYDLLLEHRLSPTSLYLSDTWPAREDLDYCLQRGLNSINLKCVADPSDADLAYLKDWANYLRGKGLLDMAYVYGFDEVQPDRYGELANAWGKIKQAIPDLKRCCTVTPNDKLKGLIDIWVPLTASYDFSTAERFRREGNEVWWYICCGPQHPYANWFIDYPATDARALFWATWKYRVTGFLYYEIAMWRTNLITAPSSDDSEQPPGDPEAIAGIKAGKRWPDIPWNTWTFSRFNGDGLLVYPGPNQTPLPSLRLEVIRDGIEDYEMLGVLSDYVARLSAWDTKHDFTFLIAEAKQLLTVNPDVVRDTTHFTSDPNVLLQERAKVAREIMRIKKVMGEK